MSPTVGSICASATSSPARVHSWAQYVQALDRDDDQPAAALGRARGRGRVPRASPLRPRRRSRRPSCSASAGAADPVLEAADGAEATPPRRRAGRRRAGRRRDGWRCTTLALAYPELERRRARARTEPARAADRRRRRPVRRRLSARRAGRQRRERRTSASSGSTRPGFPDAPEPHRRQRDRRQRRHPRLRRVDPRRSPSTPTASRSLPGRSAGSRRSPTPRAAAADPSAHADIYLKQLGDQGLFGYESVDPGQGRARSQYGYLVLDNDYAPAEYGYRRPARSRRASPSRTSTTTCCSQTYDTFQDVWLLEATATWSEEQVYPDVNDYSATSRRSPSIPSEPITDHLPPRRRRALKIYGAAVWNHWLDVGGGGFGVGVDPPRLGGLRHDRARRLRARRLRQGDRARSAARASAASSSRFAAATAEWRTGAGGFPDRASYPDVKRKGSPARRAAASSSRSTTPPTG